MAKQDFVDTGARLPTELNNKIKSYADGLGISKNAVIILALNQYLNNECSKEV